MKGDERAARALLLELDAALDEDEHLKKAQVDFLLEDFNSAATHYKQALQNDSTDYTFKAEYAISMFRSGNKSEAVHLIQTLESDREPYQYGRLDYEYAQYYAGVSDTELAMAYLKKSIAAGYFYLNFTFGNDLLFNPLKGDPRFEEILTYWH
jgi:predicted Zn-dependent protease